jgi:tetratricopeptide (TPR) repeat protein
MSERLHAQYNRILAGFVFVFTFVIYWTTVAPTVAFWDCGEYIASSHILGIPHPPGNPTYVLLGRFFDLVLFFFEEVAFRVNVLSVLSGALTAMLLYLIAVRVMIHFIGLPDTTWKRITVYLSGITAAFFAAFGYTFWFSAVEASVYIPSMLVLAVTTWLAIKWSQSSDPGRDRLLILISYLAFLGIGIHMMAMIALPSIFLFIILSDKQKRHNWPFWITGILMASVIYEVGWFLWLGPLTLLVTLVMSLWESPMQRQWRFCFWITLFALLGYSIHLYIPIRSALDPIIDENNPERLQAFQAFLERKQYGSQNFILRMFHRRGYLWNQFGIDDHMGYGGFHLTQFFHFGPSEALDRTKELFTRGGSLAWISRVIIYLIPTFFMIFAWKYLYKRNRNAAIFLITLFLIGSIGLVFYMNFADGNKAEWHDYKNWVEHGKQGPKPTVHREVRIRDYFFTSGFMFYGLWIGIAAGCLLHFLFTNRDTFYRKTLAPILVVLILVANAVPLTQNYALHDRTHDWVPYDYAYNLLMSCEKDAILFTNGDNDTFPLWFLQEAEGIRKDVRIVNLSLLNTKWYIKQLKRLEPKVPITYTEEQIDGLQHQLNPFKANTMYKMKNAGISVNVPGRSKKRALKVQDIMVLHIVDANAWQKPVQFAVTVANTNKMGLQPYMQMRGLAYTLFPEQLSAEEQFDVDRSAFLLQKTYSFRGLGSGTVPMTETSFKLMSNYAACFIQSAMELRQPLRRMKQRLEHLGDTLSREADSGTVDDSLKRVLMETQQEYDDKLELGVNLLDQCVAMMPWDWRPRLFRHQLLMEHGRIEEARARAEEALKVDPNRQEYMRMRAEALAQSDSEDAIDAYKELMQSGGAQNWQSYQMVAQKYIQAGLYDSALEIIEAFEKTHPGDRRATRMIRQIQRLQQSGADANTAPKTNAAPAAPQPALPAPPQNAGSLSVD